MLLTATSETLESVSTAPNDIQISARLWQQQFDGKAPSIDDLRGAARANFNILPEPRIRERLGISKQTVQQSFNKAIRKYEARRPLKAREQEVLKVFGLSMMGQFALNDLTLCTDFADLLVTEGALVDSDRTKFESAYQFISLYALSITGHGKRKKVRAPRTTDVGVTGRPQSLRQLATRSQLPPAAPGRGATISACLGASVKNENLDGSCLPEWHQLSLSWLAGNL